MQTKIKLDFTEKVSYIREIMPEPLSSNVLNKFETCI